MRLNWSVLKISCLAVATVVPGHAQVQKTISAKLESPQVTEIAPTPLVAKSITSPVTTLALSAEAFAPNRTRPNAANGYLISTARTLTKERKDAVALTSLRTGRTQIIPFFLEGAEQIRLESATVNRNSEIVLAGWHESSNFLAILDPAGSVKQVVNTGTYTPVRVCAASDNSIWTLGQDGKAEKENAEYKMLQHRSAEGKLIGEYLPKSSLFAKKAVNYHNQEPNSNYAALACGTESVAAYVGVGTEAYIWSEFEPSTGKFYQTIVPRVADAKMTGLVLTGVNEAYVSTTEGLHRLITIVVPKTGQHVSWWVRVGNGENDAAKTMGPILGVNGGYFVHFPTALVASKGVAPTSATPAKLEFTRLPE